MKKILNSEKFKITEVEESDFEKWLKEEFKESHPETLIKKTFPKKVMDIISSDHHKSRDGGFVISYDFWENKWYISHPGYVREVEAEGDSYLEAALEYLRKIRRENEKVLFREIEDEANKHLPKDISLEISEGSISIYRYSKGDNLLDCIASYDIEGKSIKEVIEKVNEILNDNLPF
ncbi:MAG: hypothetical protein ACTSR2_01865 [Candidatus Hodarchaeales archaeon]